MVAKLTADERGEPPSQMAVVGAEQPFSYAPAAGSAGARPGPALALSHRPKPSPEPSPKPSPSPEPRPEPAPPPAAGSAGAFLARLWHLSIAPRSERNHLKVAFFFR